MEFIPAKHSKTPERHERKRVLIAEDESDARALLVEVLREMGLDVIEAGDGRTMLAAVMAYYKDGRSPEDLDLIITDVHLPVVDGLDVLRGLRAAHWNTPTIVMTADDSDDIRRLIHHLGATVLSKPLDLDTFERTVRELLGPHRTSSQPPAARSSAAAS